MDVREKLVDLLGNIYLPIMAGPDVIGEYRIPHKLKEEIADHLIANGVTVRECKVVEIDQFKLPIDNAILILKEEYKQRVDGYTTHLSYGGNSDPAEEVHIDALGMAIAALELQKQTFPHH